MSNSHSDALIFFGATGDLAYKKIFPALRALMKHGRLNVPVIGVAESGWNLDQLRRRAQDSLEKHGGLEHQAFDKLCGLLRYVDGDYNDDSTFENIRKELGSALGGIDLAQTRRRGWHSVTASAALKYTTNIPNLF